MKNLREIVKEKILILDGAMGTEIQKYNLTEEDFRGERFRDLPGMMKGNNDMLNITRPDVISDIYRRYLEAGADIITANTFSCQRISQADYHLENCAREMAFEGARLARIECDKFSTPDKPRFVAGDVGPTNKTCSMSPDVSNPAAREITYDELFTDVCEQVDGLIEGGADVILIETIFDTLNCKAMIDAALTMMKKHGVELPVMISLTVSDLAGRTLSGQTVDAFLASLSPYPIFSVGMNCAFGAPQMKPFIEHMAQVAPYYISAHPNAGLPNEMGEYDETAESMAPQIAEFIDEGIVNIIGGCCGTSPEFIAHYARIAEGKKPHKVVEKPKYMWLSGLDLLQVDDSVHLPVDASRFVNVGERCNVAGSRKFLRLINEKNYEEAIGIARKQVADGAAVVDVNMDVRFYGKHAMERNLERTPLGHGTIAFGSRRGTSSHQYNPAVILAEKGTTETAGSCYGMLFVYSGNFSCEAEKDQFNQTRLLLGLNEELFSYPLAEGETFTVPEVILSYSADGLSALSQQYHNCIRNHVCRSKYVHMQRPVLIPLLR